MMGTDKTTLNNADGIVELRQSGEALSQTEHAEKLTDKDDVARADGHDPESVPQSRVSSNEGMHKKETSKDSTKSAVEVDVSQGVNNKNNGPGVRRDVSDSNLKTSENTLPSAGQQQAKNEGTKNGISPPIPTTTNGAATVEKSSKSPGNGSDHHKNDAAKEAYKNITEPQADIGETKATPVPPSSKMDREPSAAAKANMVSSAKNLSVARPYSDPTHQQTKPSSGAVDTPSANGKLDTDSNLRNDTDRVKGWASKGIDSVRVLTEEEAPAAKANTVSSAKNLSAASPSSGPTHQETKPSSATVATPSTSGQFDTDNNLRNDADRVKGAASRGIDSVRVVTEEEAPAAKANTISSAKNLSVSTGSPSSGPTHQETKPSSGTAATPSTNGQFDTDCNSRNDADRVKGRASRGIGSARVVTEEDAPVTSEVATPLDSTLTNPPKSNAVVSIVPPSRKSIGHTSGDKQSHHTEKNHPFASPKDVSPSAKTKTAPKANSKTLSNENTEPSEKPVVAKDAPLLSKNSPGLLPHPTIEKPSPVSIDSVTKPDFLKQPQTCAPAITKSKTKDPSNPLPVGGPAAEVVDQLTTKMIPEVISKPLVTNQPKRLIEPIAKGYVPKTSPLPRVPASKPRPQQSSNKPSLQIPKATPAPTLQSQASPSKPSSDHRAKPSIQPSETRAEPVAVSETCSLLASKPIVSEPKPVHAFSPSRKNPSPTLQSPSEGPLSTCPPPKLISDNAPSASRSETSQKQFAINDYDGTLLQTDPKDNAVPHKNLMEITRSTRETKRDIHKLMLLRLFSQTDNAKLLELQTRIDEKALGIEPMMEGKEAIKQQPRLISNEMPAALLIFQDTIVENGKRFNPRRVGQGVEKRAHCKSKSLSQVENHIYKEFIGSEDSRNASKGNPTTSDPIGRTRTGNPETKKSFVPFALEYNECSVVALSNWAFQVRSKSAENMSQKKEARFIERPTVKSLFRKCQVCGSYGHYEVECNKMLEEDVFRLSKEVTVHGNIRELLEKNAPLEKKRSRPNSRLRGTGLQENSFDDGDLPFLNCEICRSRLDDDHMLICDGCERLYHLYCLNPPLKSVPKGDWFCEACTQHHDDSCSDIEVEACDEFVIEQRKRSRQPKGPVKSWEWHTAIAVVRDQSSSLVSGIPGTKKRKRPVFDSELTEIDGFVVHASPSSRSHRGTQRVETVSTNDVEVSQDDLRKGCIVAWFPQNCAYPLMGAVLAVAAHSREVLIRQINGWENIIVDHNAHEMGSASKDIEDCKIRAVPAGATIWYPADEVHVVARAPSGNVSDYFRHEILPTRMAKEEMRRPLAGGRASSSAMLSKINCNED